MPIITKIGRNSLRLRMLIYSMYALLIVGSVTMLYPFCLLVVGSSKSAIDTPEAVLVPPFLAGSEGLYRKHMEGFFNEFAEYYRVVYNTDASSFRSATPPESVNATLSGGWKEFLDEAKLPFYFYQLSYIAVPVSKGVMPINLRRFKDSLASKYGGDIKNVNAALGTSFASWRQFGISDPNMVQRIYKIGETEWDRSYQNFKATRPQEERVYQNIPGFYVQLYLKSQYSKDIAEYNKAHGTNFTSWDQIRFARRAPPEASKNVREDWESFVRGILNMVWIRVDQSAEPHYQAYLEDRYSGDIAELNKRYQATYKSFAEIRVPGDVLLKGVAGSDWEAFIQGFKDPDGKTYKAPLESLSVVCANFIFQDWLQKKYGDVGKANAALGTSFTSWDEITPPQQGLHYLDFKRNQNQIRKEFCTRNFVSVFDYLVLNGRALLNTVVYCGLTILSALTVNPIAAYALSRFRPPSTYKVLLFLMLTMAFPPVVTQIPNFLMLREMNLLNTYLALILPGLANGYSIFLLKGFFDSLPQELYESASIDGASETRIFLQITMSLSKPILAVIALGAFTGAYGNFMMALLVCQDRNMWTIMPFLYELQQNSCQGVIFASLLVAAIPTLIVFTCCQNVIMRGIVIPVEK